MFDEIFQNVSVETVVYYVLALGVYATLFGWLSVRMSRSRTEMRRESRLLISENLSLMEAMKRVRGEMEDDDQRTELDQMWRRLLRETSSRIEDLNNDEERIIADPSERYLLLPPPLTAFGAMLSVIFVGAVFFAGAVFLYLVVTIANAELDPVTRAEDLRYGLQIAGVGLAAVALAFLARFGAYQSFKAKARKLAARAVSEHIAERVAEQTAEKKASSRRKDRKRAKDDADGEPTDGAVEAAPAPAPDAGGGKMKLRRAARMAKSEPIVEEAPEEPPLGSGESIRRVPRDERLASAQEPQFEEPPMSAAPRSTPAPAADDPRARPAEPPVADPGPPQTARFRQAPAAGAAPAGQQAARRGVPAQPATPPQRDAGASVPSTQRPSVDPGWQQVLGQSKPAGGAQSPGQRPQLRDPKTPDDDGKA